MYGMSMIFFENYKNITLLICKLLREHKESFWIVMNYIYNALKVFCICNC